MMFGYRGTWPLWQLVVMGFAMIFFVGLIMWAVYILVVGVTRRNDGGQEIEEPRGSLDRRLAQGEIDPEQYHRERELIDDQGTVKVDAGVRS
jgi:uncharacterized membrane protein